MPNLNVRISKEQEDFIKKKAEINNMNISEYVKSCLFNKNENKQVKINNEENRNANKHAIIFYFIANKFI